MDYPSFCSESDAKSLRDILTFFYPTSPPEVINQPLAALACTMFNDLAECSRSMDYVPRPPAAKPGFLYPLIQGVKMAWRQRFRRGKGAYENCRLTIALKHRTEYVLARGGVDL